VKLKRLKDKGHRDDQPRWVWQLVWIDPCSGRETSERIGYYRHSRDTWRAPGKRLPRLSEKEAEARRTAKFREVADARTGLFIPASMDTKSRWADYCANTGRSGGLAFERLLSIVGSPAFRSYEEVCARSARDPQTTLEAILTEWCARMTSDAPTHFDAVIDWYFEHGCLDVQHETRRDTRITLELFRKLCPEWLDRWQDITRDEAREFQNRLRTGRKTATVWKHISNMRKVWNALNEGWARENPWAKLKRPKIGIDKDDWHYYPRHEVAALLRVADLTWRARIRLAWKAGLRPGEIDHLRVTDIDWEAKRVHVRERDGKQTELAWMPKDKDARTVPLDDKTMALLNRLRIKRTPENPYLFVPDRRWRQALALQNLGRWRPDAVLVNGKKRRWDRIVSAAKVEPPDAPARFYSLRKTCCCDMLTAGVATHEVQAMLGHASIETTLTWYAKVNKGEAEKRIRQAQRRSG
jgi:integrase